MTERVNGADGLSPEAQAVVPIYADFIVRTNSRVRREDAEKIAEAVIRWSLHFGLDPRLVMAVALTESTFNHSTRSHAGAMGLLQLMPGTARYVGVNNAWDLEQNVYGGVKYLREQLDYFIPRHGQERGFILAIAAYNAGPGAVRRFNGVPPYRETQNYVERVTRRYRMLTGS
jgi:soluble lytic murein transglycosylase-like protein